MRSDGKCGDGGNPLIKCVLSLTAGGMGKYLLVVLQEKSYFWFAPWLWPIVDADDCYDFGLTAALDKTDNNLDYVLNGGQGDVSATYYGYI